jgi:hypothetical protein
MIKRTQYSRSSHTIDWKYWVDTLNLHLFPLLHLSTTLSLILITFTIQHPFSTFYSVRKQCRKHRAKREIEIKFATIVNCPQMPFSQHKGNIFSLNIDRRWGTKEWKFNLLYPFQKREKNLIKSCLKIYFHKSRDNVKCILHLHVDINSQ